MGQGDGAGFTRDGRFSMDASGQLVAADGLPVQGKNGTIVLNPALETSISGDGSVTQAGRLVDQLKVVKFENPGLLRKTGNGLLNGGGTAADAQAGVRQGFIEGSNVKMVEEMASMMQVMRGFESIQKAMTAQDSATGKLIASMGR